MRNFCSHRVWVGTLMVLVCFASAEGGVGSEEKDAAEAIGVPEPNANFDSLSYFNELVDAEDAGIEDRATIEDATTHLLAAQGIYARLKEAHDLDAGAVATLDLLEAKDNLDMAKLTLQIAAATHDEHDLTKTLTRLSYEHSLGKDKGNGSLIETSTKRIEVRLKIALLNFNLLSKKVELLDAQVAAHKKLRNNEAEVTIRQFEVSRSEAQHAKRTAFRRLSLRATFAKNFHVESGVADAEKILAGGFIDK